MSSTLHRARVRSLDRSVPSISTPLPRRVPPRLFSYPRRTLHHLLSMRTRILPWVLPHRRYSTAPAPGKAALHTLHRGLNFPINHGGVSPEAGPRSRTTHSATGACHPFRPAAPAAVEAAQVASPSTEVGTWVNQVPRARERPLHNIGRGHRSEEPLSTTLSPTIPRSTDSQRVRRTLPTGPTTISPTPSALPSE